MHKDIRGLPIATSSAAAAVAFDHAVDGYLSFRSDFGPRVEAVIAADADCAMAHVLKGYMAMLGYTARALPMAREASAAAAKLAPKATAREQRHLRALDEWIAGDSDKASATWQQIMRDHPLDILAFRLHHLNNFWIGRPDLMLAAVVEVEPHWSGDIPGFNAILGCRAFAHEESGLYLEAELAGREAIRRDPGDLWAAHAVAHVLEMTGRRREGIAWVDQLQNGWDGRNNLKHHLWWHQAMYALELGDMSRVLYLYDSRFRELTSPLTQAVPDLYIDVQNAASMLFRLARYGVDVGDRWAELADKAEAKIGDCLSPFTLPHWMMALAATGREDAARRLLAGMRDYAQSPGLNATIVGEVAIPVTEAVLALAQGQYAWAVALMRPVLGDMYRLGGSHAQQDVLEQVFLDAAIKAGLDEDRQLLLERVAARHPLPPSRRRGYVMAA